MLFKSVSAELRRVIDCKKQTVNERTLWEYTYVANVIEEICGNRWSVRESDCWKIRERLGQNKLGEPISPVSHKRWLTHCKTLFKKVGVTVKQGDALKAPPARLIRKRRNDRKMLEAAEIRRLIDAADSPLRFMILMGINCGFGPQDCELLPEVGEFYNFARPKTEQPRRCKLWNRTLETMPDLPVGWDRHRIAGAYRKIGGKGFYNLRRTFLTVATSSGASQAAIDRIMGWVPRDVAGIHYRVGVFDSDIEKATSYVEDWLFG